MKKYDVRKERERQRRESNKDIILHAAEAVIMRKGLSAVTMDGIAREARFSKATLYQYIRGKGDLVYEIVLHYLDDIRSMLEGIGDREACATEKLRAAVRSIFRTYDEKANLSRMIMMDDSMMRVMKVFAKDRKDSSPRERAFLKSVKDKWTQINLVIGAIFKEGIDGREFRTMDAGEATNFLSILLQGTLHRQYGPNGKVSVAEEADRIYDFLLRGIENKDVFLKGESQ